jgi:hypothetical protein
LREYLFGVVGITHSQSAHVFVSPLSFERWKWNICTFGYVTMLRSAILIVIYFTTVLSLSSLRPRARKLSHNTRLFERNSNDPSAELTNTLALLDQQWKIQQKSQPRSRWTTLILPKNDEHKKILEAPPFSPVNLGHDFCYLLEPPNNSVPSCLIVFTGGAGLGTYPQISYNEFLVRLSNRLNAAIITAPYQVGLDHFALAKNTGDITRRAILHCQDDPSRQYSTNIPTFSLSHSLGSKLACIYVTATEQNYDGIGYISFNNFSFGATIGMAKEFASVIRNSAGYDDPISGIPSDAINSLFNFAEMAISAAGIDFSPSQNDMDRLIRMKYGDELRCKTRFFSFDDDLLENTQDVVAACGDVPMVSGLPGTHLTPVYFKLGLEDLELPDDAKEVASDAMGGFRNLSFGNDEELEFLVSEVCKWILSENPTRHPKWKHEQPLLAGQSTSTDSTETII